MEIDIPNGGGRKKSSKGEKGTLGYIKRRDKERRPRDALHKKNRKRVGRGRRGSVLQK